MRLGRHSISHPINSLIRLRWDLKWDEVGRRESYKVIDGDKGRCGVSTAAYWEGRMSLTCQDHKNMMSLFFPLSHCQWLKQTGWWMRLQALDGVRGKLFAFVGVRGGSDLSAKPEVNWETLARLISLKGVCLNVEQRIVSIYPTE